MSWTFQGIAYQTKRDYFAAIAQEWLSAGGANSRRYIREAFFDATDEELADEVIEGWSLDGQQPPLRARRPHASLRRVSTHRRGLAGPGR